MECVTRMFSDLFQCLLFPFFEHLNTLSLSLFSSLSLSLSLSNVFGDFSLPCLLFSKQESFDPLSCHHHQVFLCLFLSLSISLYFSLYSIYLSLSLFLSLSISSSLTLLPLVICSLRDSHPH